MKIVELMNASNHHIHVSIAEIGKHPVPLMTLRSMIFSFGFNTITGISNVLNAANQNHVGMTPVCGLTTVWKDFIVDGERHNFWLLTVILLKLW
jgi:hypothetical protein